MGYFSLFGALCQQWYYAVMDAKFIKSTLFSLILLGLSFSFVTATFKVVQRSKRLTEAKQELLALQEEKKHLEERAEYVKSPEFVEEEARNKLNMVKPGEEVYLKPKILGDDLLGAQDDGDYNRHDNQSGNINPTIFTRLFDKIKQFLLLFQG